MTGLGHLFVVRGDLTTLHADAHLVPTDGRANVGDHWRAFLEPARWSMGDQTGWHRLADVRTVTEGQPVRLSGSRWVFASASDDPHHLTEIVAEAVTAVARSSTVRTDRTQPLVALPLPGTGDGGLKHDRGGVIAKLVPALRDVAASTGADIAVVLGSDRDEAAVQATRHSTEYWKALDDGLCRHADAIGEMAADRAIALFLGAGVSKPLGLPDWKTFLDDLAAAADVTAPAQNEPLPQYAARIATAYGSDLTSEISKVFTTSTYALGHGLLASLRLTAAVTTNYDAGYETAVRGIERERDAETAISVLARVPVRPRTPWVLKLHGDAATSNGLVLTADQYADHLRNAQPLRGLVQGLMITSHLLFVGYSLVDDTFIDLANGVRSVTKDAERRDPYGTVLAITEDAGLRTRCGDDLVLVAMTPAGVADGPRMLEVFLDRVAWRARTLRSDATSYLLDPHFANAEFSEEELALREALRTANLAMMEIDQRRAPDTQRSHAFREMQDLLRRLGAQ